MTKGSGYMLFVADSTRERMANADGQLQLVGELEVRGRVQPVPVWTIADDASSSETARQSAGSEEPREAVSESPA
jgi:class 3 adenylate cyclase